ncbi:hypothetical protein HDU67_003900 [Dinochytrium kinnereticum]|nr:hypothetical protein HDU67_003900 [Dinochytrium kinnereticum]
MASLISPAPETKERGKDRPKPLSTSSKLSLPPSKRQPLPVCAVAVEADQAGRPAGLTAGVKRVAPATKGSSPNKRVQTQNEGSKSRLEELEAVIREHLGTGKFFLVESGVTFTDLTNEVYTPKDIILAAKSVIGKDCFDLDPATCLHANEIHEGKIAKKIYDEASDGLSKPWNGDVWLSPPHGADVAGIPKQAQWFFAGEEKFFNKEITSLFVLIKAALGHSWFMAFSTPTGKEKIFADESHVLVYMGPNVEAFCTKFKNMGSIPGLNAWFYHPKPQSEDHNLSTLLPEYLNLQQTISQLQKVYYTSDAIKLRKQSSSRTDMSYLAEVASDILAGATATARTTKLNGDVMADIDSFELPGQSFDVGRRFHRGGGEDLLREAEDSIDFGMELDMDKMAAARKLCELGSVTMGFGDLSQSVLESAASVAEGPCGP